MEQWSSRAGFLLAAIGAAVGLGNIWRFSAVVGQNGGGAYLVPYLLAAFVFALPLLVLEIAVGRSLRVDVVGAFRSVRRRFEPLGWLVAGSVVVVLSYYLVLTGWVLSFLAAALGGTGMEFAGYTGTYWPVAAFVAATLVTGVIVSRGVRAGIEGMATVAMPVIFVSLVALAGYATTLPGFAAGVEFFLTPDFSVLADPLLWSAAFGQVFFSLSVGQGIMLTYGSYLDEGVDVVRSSVVITVADIAVAVVSGLVIFPIVFTFGMEPTLGTELAFTTLPRAFAQMPFGGVVAVGFFGLLFLAALSSAVSLLEVGVAAVMRSTGQPRRRVTAAMTALVFALGLPSALSYSAADWRIAGVPVLDWMDETVGTLGLPVTALLIAVVFTWFQNRETVREQLGDAPLLRPLLRYAIPAVLFVVTALRLATRFEIPAWRLLPGVRAVGTLPGAGVAAGVLLALLLVGRSLTRNRRRIRSRLEKLHG